MGLLVKNHFKLICNLAYVDFSELLLTVVQIPILEIARSIAKRKNKLLIFVIRLQNFSNILRRNTFKTGWYSWSFARFLFDCFQDLSRFLRFAYRDFEGKVCRSSHRRCSVKKMILKISQISQENTCVWVSFQLIYWSDGLQFY